MPTNLNAPALYSLDFENFVKHPEIEGNTVISVDSELAPLSRFDDEIWDFTFVQGPKMYWSNWTTDPEIPLNQELTNEMKTVFYSVVLAYPKGGLRRNKKSYKQYQQVLIKLARMMQNVGTCYSKALSNNMFQHSLQISMVNAFSDKTWSASNASAMKSIFGAMIKLVADHPDYPFLPMSSENYGKFSPLLSKLQKGAKNDTDRTKLIPSRIYSGLIRSVLADLHAIEPHLNDLKDLMYLIGHDATAGATNYDIYRNNKKRIRRARGGSFMRLRDLDVTTHKSFKELLMEHDLVNLFARLNQEEVTVYEQIFDTLSRYQARAILAVYIFTGMRSHEIELIPYDCIENLNINGFGETVLINTHTSKLNKGEATESLHWVTDKNGALAVKVLQALAHCFHAIRGSRNTFPEDEVPLILAPEFFEKKGAHYDFSTRNLSGMFKSSEFPYPFAVQAEDIEELERFDGLRDWQVELTEKVDGKERLKDWKFAPHQFRRALCVYAARSGLVELTDLASQLKHLSQSMTAMYTENSAFAETFVVKNGKIKAEHKVVEEFRAAQLLNMSDAFHRDILESRATGPVGDKMNLAQKSGKLPKIFTDRESTARAIKNGQTSYRETIVGGCTKSDYCEAYELDEVVPCVFDCASASLNNEKLAKYANNLEAQLKHTSKHSPFGREAEAHLKRIKLKLIEEAEV